MPELDPNTPRLSETGSDTLYEEIFTHAPIGILITDPGARIVQHNPEAEQILLSSDLLGKTIQDLISPDMDSSVFHASLTAPAKFPLFLTLITTRGREIRVHLHPLRREGYCCLFLEDNTGILTLEQELRNFKTAIESADDSILLFDEQGLIFYANPAFEKMIALPPEKILGRNLRQFWSEHDPPVVHKDIWQCVLKGQNWAGEMIWLQGNRAPINVEVRITPIFSETKKILGFICVQRDISHRKRIEKQLAEYSGNLEKLVAERTRALSNLHDITQLFHRTETLDQRLRLILIAATAGETFRFNRAFILLVDKDRRMLEGRIALGPSSPEEANRIWSQLEQTIPKDTLAKRLQAYLDHVGQGDYHVNQMVKKLAVPLTHESSILVKSIRRRRAIIVKEGKADVEFDTSILGLLGQDHFAVIPLLVQEDPIGVLIVDKAITKQAIGSEDIQMLEILAAQAALAIAHANTMEELAKKVKETEHAYSQLRESQEKLFEAGKFAALGQMAATVAHEIRTPLVAIGGFVNLLLKNRDAGDPEYSHLRIVRDEALRLEDVLNRLLFYARPSSPMTQIQDLNSFIKLVLTFLSSELEFHEIEVVLRLQENLPPVPFDRNLMRQVLLNVLQNAIQSMENGGTITLETKEDNQWVDVLVRDTGVGIAEENLHRIFEPFFSTKHAGTGLGLHVSQRIVQGHGGTLRVDSRLGKGTTVAIRLPKRQEVPSEKNLSH
ncbi:MAG: PAS domain-containing protein [bacterium]